jgi:hypothetical protein
MRTRIKKTSRIALAGLAMLATTAVCCKPDFLKKKEVTYEGKVTISTGDKSKKSTKVFERTIRKQLATDLPAVIISDLKSSLKAEICSFKSSPDCVPDKNTTVKAELSVQMHVTAEGEKKRIKPIHSDTVEENAATFCKKEPGKRAADGKSSKTARLDDLSPPCKTDRECNERGIK